MDKIVEILSQYTEVPADQIKPESKILEDLGLTSLDVMDLIGALEDEYDLEISDAEIRSISTVQDIEDFISSHVSD